MSMIMTRLYNDMVQQRKEYSVAHPSRHSVGPEASRKAQACRAHGEVANEIPDQADDLDDGGDEGEDGAVELMCGVLG